MNAETPPELPRAEQELIGLQTILLATIVALIAYVQEKSFRWNILAACALITLPSLFWMLRFNTPSFHAVTRRSAILSFRIYLGVLIAVVIAFFFEAIPGQAVEPARLPVGEAHPYEFENDSTYKDLTIKKKDPGVDLFVPISRNLFVRGQIPDPLWIKVQLPPILANQMTLADASGVSKVNSGKADLPPPSIHESKSNRSTQWISWPKVGDKRMIYLRLRYHVDLPQPNASVVLKRIEATDGRIDISALQP
ncbi:MAG: hypothetical protein K8T91_05820 [Planctomycetes bacterium]|nr:hypothetical protein [Planctomycetota bacterium]